MGKLEMKTWPIQVISFLLCHQGIQMWSRIHLLLPQCVICLQHSAKVSQVFSDG